MECPQKQSPCVEKLVVEWVKGRAPTARPRRGRRHVCRAADSGQRLRVSVSFAARATVHAYAPLWCPSSAAKCCRPVAHMSRTPVLILILLGLLAAFAFAEEDAKDGKLKIGVKFRPENCARKTEVRSRLRGRYLFSLLPSSPAIPSASTTPYAQSIPDVRSTWLNPPRARWPPTARSSTLALTATTPSSSPSARVRSSRAGTRCASLSRLCVSMERQRGNRSHAGNTLRGSVTHK